MTSYNPRIKTIENFNEAVSAIKEIESDENSINIMAPKMIHRVIKLDNVLLQDAIIIKQDMLSIGGEVAVPKYTFELSQKTSSILIIGSLSQHKKLINKLKRHYPRIQSIADELNDFIEKIS